MDPLSLGLFAVLGIAAGTLAGLLGIGGGMLIVPGLFYLFDLIQLPQESLMHMAAGSSMCIMICTAASSTWAHHRQEHIQWSIFRTIIAGIAVGVVSGNLLANRMPTQLLELIFGIFLLVVSTKIFFEKKSEDAEEQTVGAPGIVPTSAVGMVIGFKSGVLGIGGGALSVPFLLYCGLPMKKASGTSASFTLPIAIVGTLSFLLLSGNQTAIPWSTGYVYWPAVLLVAPFTMLGAPIGAKFAGIVAPEKLRTIFAGLLLVISMRMLSGTGLIAWDFPLV
ncbi:sulfite exporter TauE/SafE family protein [Acaryochloris marina]|uniref:Probable membrane transporter protein n=1 Tax=Acaryochloris marina (strain MBIC 11017) TaxID=329726 RepID=B0C5Q9_ACAM1|nr:sulfite exporter TauE/SafE family protein [Acaryochloris marina]ABW28780.1 conserved hypothetical membrane protein [Acaryochloris marina MBIC11017]BDM77767.1 UPF0721 transmembrane protein [Acaryochloris marina MBIC10699]